MEGSNTCFEFTVVLEYEYLIELYFAWCTAYDVDDHVMSVSSVNIRI